jgi:GT2 family glycosyltransferase
MSRSGRPATSADVKVRSTLPSALGPRPDPANSAQRAESLASFIVDIELSQPVSGIASPGRPGSSRLRGWLLVRLFTEPIGLVPVDVPETGLSAERVVEAIAAGCGPELSSRLAALGLHGLTPHGIELADEAPFLVTRRFILESAEHFTVAVCTRERPETLRRTLISLAVQDYPSFDVLVVDNAPTSDGTMKVVEDMQSELSVRYVVEPAPGLSRARNRALREIGNGLIAWLDDDETADPHWLAELARGFAENPGASAVSGVVVPAELRTRVQVWFEQFGGHSKGRGFVTAAFSPATAAQQSPLYPLPPFGVGANMAFRAKALHDIGGFDEALGAGTPAKASEDTKVFTQLLLRGETTVYQHTALTRHYHRSDLAGLSEQLIGYGIGLTAYYTSLILDNPMILGKLIKLLPRAYRDMSGGGRLQISELGEDFPTELLARNVRGMLIGPGQYLRARRLGRKLARNVPGTPEHHPGQGSKNLSEETDFVRTVMTRTLARNLVATVRGNAPGWVGWRDDRPRRERLASPRRPAARWVNAVARPVMALARRGIARSAFRRRAAMIQRR